MADQYYHPRMSSFLITSCWALSSLEALIVLGLMNSVLAVALDPELIEIGTVYLR